MLRHRQKFFSVGIVLLLCSLTAGNSVAQMDTSMLPSVAILVVDVFESESEALEPPPPVIIRQNIDVEIPADYAEAIDATGGQCAISFEGHDGLVVQGGSAGILEITSQLRPFAVTHGDAVFEHFQHVMDDTGYQSEPLPADLGLDGIVRSNAAQRIYLVKVDTQQYRIDLIAQKVTEAMQALNTAVGITNFVVNMSFGIVPCDAVPLITPELYIETLNSYGIEADCSASDLPALGALSCQLNNGSFAEDFVNTFASIRSEGGATATALGLLHLLIVRPLLEDAFHGSIPVTGANFPVGITDVTVTTSPAASFIDAIQGFADAEAVIQVASAGNDDLAFPYYPGIDPAVLSVAADYSQSMSSVCSTDALALEQYLIGTWGFPEAFAQAVAETTMNRISNAAEVMENGNTRLTPTFYFSISGADSLGCLWGTSFAAPRVSVLMAERLGAGRGSVCTGTDTRGAQVLMSQPPLAHNAWDSLTITDASFAYCPDFP